MHAMLCFVDVLVAFVAKMADSLTDVEFAMLLEAFIPAVKEAYVKSRSISSGGGGLSSSTMGGGELGGSVGGPAPPKGAKKGSGRGGSAGKSDAPSSLAPK
jgi:hypothetical protein